MPHLPTFSTIKVEQIQPQLQQLLEHNRQEIKRLLMQSPPFTWDNLLRPLEDMDDKLHQFWSPITHLHSVKDTPELRKAYEACLPMLSDYATELAHNKELYNAIKSIADSEQYQHLDRAQRKIIDNEIRDFKLAGVALSTEKKKRFAEISKKLSQLTSQFSNNVLDATYDWHLHITDEKELSGIPDHAVQTAREVASQKKLSGYVFTLEFPSYYAIMSYADSRSRRQQMYEAYTTRASELGPTGGKWDNSRVMHEILTLRLELAHLLDFKHYAEKSLATKMVAESQHVLDFLQALVEASIPKAKQEFAELKAFAEQHFNVTELNAWDIAYYSEKLRQHSFAISPEELRPYFPETKVVSGLFAIVNKLFEVTIKPVANVDTWHPDVKCYALYDSDNNICAYCYFDLYAREGKRGGAWMDDCRIRRRLVNNELQLPVAYVNTNFNAPVGNNPACFTHSEVITLFHEFGHALQHMLTKMEYADVSGINGVPWDAVEVASQFLENWAWEKESISYIAQHYQTKEPLPDDLFQKLLKAKTFQSAMQMMRQLEFALFDFRLHVLFNPKQDNQIQQILDEVRSNVTVVPTPEFNRFQHGFSHIFAGGYAAGYYSYKWAEVMAADAFELFKEKGIFNREISKKFQSTFMEQGGSQEPLDLFIAFRGREPQVDALLKQSGIR